MLNPESSKLQSFGIPLRSRHVRRVFLLGYYAAFLVTIFLLALRHNAQITWPDYIVASIVSAAFGLLGPFRHNGPVKDPVIPATRYPGKVMLTSLDDWSRYYHGGPFEALPIDQQRDVLSRYRVGSYVFADNGSLNRIDEREQMQLDRATARANRMIIGVISFSGLLLMYEVAGHALSPGAVPYIFIVLLFVAATLPKAIILWDEPEPMES